MRLTPLGKVILLVLVVGVAIGGYRLWGMYGGTLVPAAPGKDSVVPRKADLPTIDGQRELTPVSSAEVQMPGTAPAQRNKPEIRYLGYAWNSQMGLQFAIGGQQTTQGSLMDKHGVNFRFERQDYNDKLQEALVTFATELDSGTPHPSRGAHFVATMGDGSAAFLKGLNDSLRKIGPEYTAKIVGSCGYSRGEDKFMGPAEWKTNPAASKGGLCAGVLRDGDWNIAQKWLADNGLKTNPDEKTFDPDALNWVNTPDYLDPVEKYITGYSEERPEVRNGKRTGKTVRVTVNSVVTWTPGDVNVAQKKGGLVSIASTREYASQMPNVIIGIDKWMRDNRSTVQSMLMAISEGGMAVRTNPEALTRAAQISATNYAEKGTDASYWERYYKGVQEPDKTGQVVDLGGSLANTLPDQLFLFGLVPGSANLFEATYTVFGDVVKQQYPEIVPSYYPVVQILDTSYLQGIAKQAPAPEVAQVKPTFDPKKTVKRVVSRKAWKIEFKSGQAAFTPGALKQLEQLRRDLLVASGTVVEVHGHTDGQGDPDKNMELSEQRAFAVQKWLQKKSPANFPEGRVRVFSHGETNPLASNSSEAGRSKNRRVEIVLGTTTAVGG